MTGRLGWIVCMCMCVGRWFPSFSCLASPWLWAPIPIVLHSHLVIVGTLIFESGSCVVCCSQHWRQFLVTPEPRVGKPPPKGWDSWWARFDKVCELHSQERQPLVNRCLSIKPSPCTSTKRVPAVCKLPAKGVHTLGEHHWLECDWQKALQIKKKMLLCKLCTLVFIRADLGHLSSIAAAAAKWRVGVVKKTKVEMIGALWKVCLFCQRFTSEFVCFWDLTF